MSDQAEIVAEQDMEVHTNVLQLSHEDLGTAAPVKMNYWEKTFCP